MPPKQPSGARSRPQAGSSKQAAAAAAAEDSSDAAASSDPFDSDDSPPRRRPQAANRETSSGDATADKSIPKDLLTRILHDLFEKDATRVSRDANAAVGKYVDVFVREAIARTAVEKRSGFLEVCYLFFFSSLASDGRGGTRMAADLHKVEDLEKIAPQLLLDL